MTPVSQNLVVAYRPIDSLTPYSKNARTHSKQQLRQIADSIKAFGFINPVLVNDDNMIVAGHGRVAAAKLLAMTEVPTISLAGLTRDQVRAYILADNKLTENAGWDQSILKIELQHLISLQDDLEITLTGFSVPEIDLILQVDEPQPEESVVISECPVVSKAGDLWQLGPHRIYCGSSLEPASYAQLLDGHLADVVFTDPPYNVRIDGHASGNGSIHHEDFAMASGEMSSLQFIDFLQSSLALMAHSSVDGAVHFVCMDWRHAKELLQAGEKVYNDLINMCVWVKDNGGMGSFYRSQHELVFVFRHGKNHHRNNVQLGKFGRNRTNVWEYPGANTLSRGGSDGNLLALHPTVKPVAMIADALLDCSAPNSIVLDGFFGVGSTILAAERTGRIGYGIELNAKYVDTAVRRWENATGQSAVLHSSRKSFLDLSLEVSCGR